MPNHPNGFGAHYSTTVPIKGLRSAGYVGPCTVKDKDGNVIDVIAKPPTWEEIQRERHYPTQLKGAAISKQNRRNNHAR